MTGIQFSCYIRIITKPKNNLKAQFFQFDGGGYFQTFPRKREEKSTIMKMEKDNMEF